MQVRTTTSAAIPDEANDFAALYFLTNPYIKLIHMGVKTFVAITVIDNNVVSITTYTVIGTNYFPVTARIDGSSTRGAKVHAVMEFFCFGEGIVSVAIPRRHTVHVFTFHGLNGRNSPKQFFFVFC